MKVYARGFPSPPADARLAEFELKHGDAAAERPTRRRLKPPPAYRTARGTLEIPARDRFNHFDIFRVPVRSDIQAHGRPALNAAAPGPARIVGIGCFYGSERRSALAIARRGKGLSVRGHRIVIARKECFAATASGECETGEDQ